MKSFITLLTVVFCFSCAVSHKAQNNQIGSLKFINEYEVPYNQESNGTTIGGLSGIDYDAEKGIYYLISDDRSAINPARFYTAKIIISDKGIDTVQWIATAPMLQSNGSPYPNSKQDPAHTPDPEAIRYNKKSGELIWTSEGERIVRGKDTVLENPAITRISLNGKYIDTFPLPANLLMRATEKGPRQNGVLEGLTFDNNFKTMYVNVEEPLYEDGPRADIKPNNAWIRIYQYDVASKKNTAQFAYHLEPIAYPSTPETAFKINGVPDIYAIGNNQLIVLERSFSSGRLPCTLKVFLADLNGAEDIKENSSLIINPVTKPVKKKLLLNMDDLKIYTDNIEGVTFGPTLANGHRTLIFVSDNNFASFEKTQLLLFEILP
ncbi:MAG: esterase-like activity of phytase family protein [Bacteroidetes bacterium]|nr:esterase-like activity of phytase family protein [Bacteroidota bacterium]